MLFLVVVNPFGPYQRGSMIIDTNAINGIRSSENASQVVIVSDEPIPEPEPPPPLPDFGSLQSAYQQQQALIQAQQAALMAAIAVNASQTNDLAAQANAINQLSAALVALEAKVDAQPGTGTPIPPDLADDLPLAEADGVVIATAGGKVLVGDIRA